MGFAFLVIALLGIGLLIVSAALFVFLIVGSVFSLFMGVKLRTTEKKISTGFLSLRERLLQ